MVTGSRIARSRDLSAPSPITTINTDLFENNALTGMESVLNSEPQFVPQNNQFTSGIQPSPTNEPGAVNLNLRGLGKNRNLVLIDGRRGQPGDASLAVDINTIPQSAIDSVETITGGASAVYGPDAMAGVVNFKLKHDFQGLDINVQTAGSEHGDGFETHASILTGLNSGDGKGNIMFGIDWDKRDAIYESNRSFYSRGWLDPNDPSGGFIVAPAFAPASSAGNLPTQAAFNSIFPQAAPGTVGPSTEVYFNADGSPFIQQGALGYNGPLNTLAPGRYSAIKVLGPDTSAPGSLDQAFTQGFLSVPLERHSFFVRGNYNVTDNLTAYTQANFSNVQVETNGGLAPAITIWQSPIPRYSPSLCQSAPSATCSTAADDSAWLPPALETLLNSRPNPQAPWYLFQVTDYLGPEFVDNTTNLWQVLAGLKGTLPFRDWSWDAYFSRGDTHIEADYSGLPSLQRLQYLVALPDFGKGAKLSEPAGAPFGYGESCTSGIPVFQQFQVSADCVQSITDPMKNETDLRQDIFEAHMQGAAFKLPGGEVRFDLGISYRDDDFSFSPGNPVAQIADNPVGLFPSNYTNGSTNEKDVFGELLVPILQDRLDLELGYRLTDFNTAGDKSTYKALFTWRPLDTVSFRGGYQAATRAPNVAELFTGPTQQVVPFPMEDPCSATTLSPWGNVPSNPNRAKVQALCEALIGNMTSQFNTQTYNTPNGPDGWTRQSPKFFPLEIQTQTGNPKVKPETGRTITIGAVFTHPLGISRLNATLDYYHIDISDTILPESSITIYNNCFNYNGQSNPTYDVNNPNCQLIQRDPLTGDRAAVTSLYTNLGTLLTSGFDLNINWTHDLGPGTFALNTEMNYLLQYKYQNEPGSPFIDARGTLDTVGGAAGEGGLFDFRARTDFSYTWQALTVGLSWEHLSSIKDASASTDPATTVLPVPSYDIFGLQSSYAFGRITVRFGITNLFNKQPPVVTSQPGVTDAANVTNTGLYDPIGREYYLGLKASL